MGEMTFGPITTFRAESVGCGLSNTLPHLTGISLFGVGPISKKLRADSSVSWTIRRR